MRKTYNARRKAGRITILLAIILTTVSMVQSQSATSDWTNVRQLKSGTLVVVETKAGTVVKGSVNLADDGYLVVLSRRGEKTLPSGSIAKIYMGRQKSKKRAGIAAAVVFIATAVALTPADITISPDWPTLLPVLGGVGAAALTRKLLMKGIRKGELVYKSGP